MVCLLLKLLHYVGRDVSTVLLGRLHCGNVQLWCWSQGLWSWSCFHHWLFGHVIYCCSRCRLWLCHHPLHGVDSVHLEILLMGTCWQCGLWSVAFHNHKKVGETPFVQVSTTWALPVQKRFIRDHFSRGRSKPSCRIIGLVKVVWLTTEADDQSCLHCVIVSTDVMSDHIGRRDASHGGGCSKTSTFTGQFRWASMIWPCWV